MKDKIDPGEGYRLLQIGEEIQIGDQFHWIDGRKERWDDTSYNGHIYVTGAYRRRIAPGEVQCRYCGTWKQATQDCPKCQKVHVTEAPSAGFDVPIRPMFEKRALATLKRVTDTFGQRGTEYGDTMRDCQWLVIRAVAKQLGVDIPPDKARAIAIAGMVDIKYQRYQGGYKDDNGVDGIAYQAFLTDEMSELMAGGAK